MYLKYLHQVLQQCLILCQTLHHRIYRCYIALLLVTHVNLFDSIKQHLFLSSIECFECLLPAALMSAPLHASATLPDHLPSVPLSDIYLPEVNPILSIRCIVYFQLPTHHLRSVKVSEGTGGKVLVPVLNEAEAFGGKGVTVEFESEEGEGANEGERLRQVRDGRVVRDVADEHTAGRRRCVQGGWLLHSLLGLLNRLGFAWKHYTNN